MNRVFAILNGLVLFGVLCQGLSAGLFMGHLDAAGWLRVHQVTAIATMVVALATAVLAFRRRGVVVPTVGMLVLLVVQTGLGQAVTDDHRRVLVALHVPIALLLTALSACLFVAAARRVNLRQAVPDPAR
jgi:heme A synthase